MCSRSSIHGLPTRSASPCASRIARLSPERCPDSRAVPPMTPEPAVDAASSEPVRTRPAEWIAHRERGSVPLLKAMVFLSLRLGRAASRVLLHGIVLYFLLFAPGAARQSRRYLELALGR